VKKSGIENLQFSPHGARLRTNLTIKTITAITRSRLLKAIWQINPMAQSTSKITKIAQNIKLSFDGWKLDRQRRRIKVSRFSWSHQQIKASAAIGVTRKKKLDKDPAINA
jgi:hypothetical protein